MWMRLVRTPRARSALERALVEHRRVPQPFELARTLLVKGEVERRATLGAPLWAQRARDDLARVAGTQPR